MLQFMKATVTINSRGVVTLPAKLRQALGLKADDVLIAETTPEGLLLPSEVIAQEIVDDLEAALEQFRLIAGDLGGTSSETPAG
jgi:bifunctional DNA-binding transcriptional regulator/antitoxin component of YhaV-PrlF toxin-antitoxin module